MGMFWSVLKLAPVIHSLLSRANLLTLRRCLCPVCRRNQNENVISTLFLKHSIVLIYTNIYIHPIKKVFCVTGYVCEKRQQQRKHFFFFFLNN